jgi:hypothetical protein
MQIITIELLNDETMALLQQLEQLKLLRLIKPKEKSTKRSWSGSISKNTGEQMLLSVEKSRNEWERNIS